MAMVKLCSVKAPSLSVARTVTVDTPGGAAGGEAEAATGARAPEGRLAGGGEQRGIGAGERHADGLRALIRRTWGDGRNHVCLRVSTTAGESGDGWGQGEAGRIIHRGHREGEDAAGARCAVTDSHGDGGAAVGIRCRGEGERAASPAAAADDVFRRLGDERLITAGDGDDQRIQTLPRILIPHGEGDGGGGRVLILALVLDSGDGGRVIHIRDGEAEGHGIASSRGAAVGDGEGDLVNVVHADIGGIFKIQRSRQSKGARDGIQREFGLIRPIFSPGEGLCRSVRIRGYECARERGILCEVLRKGGRLRLTQAADDDRSGIRHGIGVERVRRIEAAWAGDDDTDRACCTRRRGGGDSGGIDHDHIGRCDGAKGHAGGSGEACAGDRDTGTAQRASHSWGDLRDRGRRHDISEEAVHRIEAIRRGDYDADRPGGMSRRGGTDLRGAVDREGSGKAIKGDAGSSGETCACECDAGAARRDASGWGHAGERRRGWRRAGEDRGDLKAAACDEDGGGAGAHDGI